VHMFSKIVSLRACGAGILEFRSSPMCHFVAVWQTPARCESSGKLDA
jgi:hypothetical protein